MVQLKRAGEALEKNRLIRFCLFSILRFRCLLVCFELVVYEVFITVFFSNVTFFPHRLVFGSNREHFKCRRTWRTALSTLLEFSSMFKPFLTAKREEKPQGIKATSTFRRARKSYTGSVRWPRKVPTLKALLLYWKPHILENPLLAPKKENEIYIRVVAKADIYESSVKSTAIFKNPELWYDWKYRHAVKHMYSNVRATFNSLPSPLKVRDVPLA